MTLTGLEPALERVLDLAGVFVFAVSGASLAVRRHFDMIGMVVLATATGLGGGILRDALIGELPPVAFRDQLYLAMPLLGTVLVATRGAAEARSIELHTRNTWLISGQGR